MEHTLKRLLSFAVALFMVISMIPASALPVFAAEETATVSTEAASTETTGEGAEEETIVYPEGWSVEYHCVCGNPSSKGNPCAEGGHKMVEWKPWTVDGTVPFRAGYWYLTNNITCTNANQFKYGSNFSTNTGVIGRDAVDGASALLGTKVDVYVDLNGKTVTGNSGHRIYRLENDYAHNLTICDTVGTGKLIAKSGATNTNAGMLFWTRNSGSRITLYGGTFDGSATTIYSATGDAAGAAINNLATIDIYGGTIIGGTANAPTSGKYARGGNINNTGTLNIHGGTIKGGTATGANAQGATIWNKGTLNIYGGTVEGGTATGTAGVAQGGNIRNEKNMNVYGGTITGGTISGTTAKQGANVSNVSTFKMYGGTITGGTATGGNGGSFFSTNGGTMEGGTITGGSAAYGGCVYIYNGTFAMSGNASVTSGKATTGGNICMNNKTTAVITMTGNASVTNGQATKGGNIYLNANSALTMNGGTISGGLAAAEDGTVASGNQGGNVYSLGTATINGGIVTNAARTTNNAHRGASLYAGNGGKVVVTGGTVVAGQAIDFGGAIGTETGGTITISGGVITAAAYADGTPITDPADVFTSGRKHLASCAGAAIGTWGGTVNISGGTIIGGTHGGAGGHILSVHGGAQATISGGLFTGGNGGGSALYGGTISVYGSGSKLTMTGGTVTNNICAVGAVNVRNSGAVEISGDVVINGNHTPAGVPMNLNLGNVTSTSGTYVQSQVIVGTMGSKADIGVTTTATGAFTTAAVSEANAAAFVGDGNKMVTQLEDGTLSLVAGHAAHCVCGGTTDRCDHTALSGEWIAWDGKSAIVDGGNYYLTQNVTEAGGGNQRWIGGGTGNTEAKTINLCLNGYSYDSKWRALAISPNVTINIHNCKYDQSVLQGCSAGTDSAGVIFCYGSGQTVNLYGNIKVVAKTVDGRNTSSAGVINVTKEFNMYGGELVGKYVTGVAGAVNVESNATFNMYGGKISGGNAAGGGNIYLNNGAKFNMYDGEIAGGVSRGVHGGNLYVTADAVANIQGGVIRDGVVTVAEGLTGDPADKNGGNIAMVDQDNDDLGGLTIGGTAVIKNGTANRGGNIFVHTGKLTIEGSAKIEGGTEYGVTNPGAPSVEVNWSRGESNVNNRTYVTISGTPEINAIRYNDYIDTTGLEAGAKIGLTRTYTGKVSSDVLSAELAACFTSTKTSVKLINETDALYAHVLKHVEAVEASCHQSGMQEYWYCSRCDIVYADEAGTQITNIKNLTIEAEPLTYVAAVEATCHQNGCAEYWYCETCEAVFTDAAGTQLTNIKNLTIAANPLTHVEAVEATCHQNGMQEYWYCETCDAVFADAAGTQLINRVDLVIPATVGLTYVAAEEATCHQNGHAEYWYCAECEAVFSDAAGTQLTNIKNLTIAANPLTHVEAVEATCHQNGMQEYWYCAECEAVFADAAGVQLTNRMNLVIPYTAEIIHVEAVEANCHQNGNVEHWYCAECETVFTDAALTQISSFENVVIPYTAEIIHVEAVEANCHQNGSAEYWYCAECEAVFADAALTQLTNVKNLVIPATVGLAHVEAVAAGLHTNGCAEYWYCAECDCVFADAAATMLTNRKNLVIVAEHELAYVEAVEAGLHQPGVAEYWYCAECDAFFADAEGKILTNYKNLINGEAEHPLTYVAAVEAGLHQNGVAEYWYCEICDAFFADPNGIQVTNYKNLINAEAEHPLTYVAAVEVGCHQNGYAEYWYCAQCDAVFADANGIQLTNIKNLTIAAEPLTYVPAVEPTFEANGNYEYWYCETCDAVFADAAGTQLTNRKNLTIPALIAVAQIGEQKFQTLAEAVAAAGTEATEILLINDFELTSSVMIAKGQNITLNLNGHTITGKDNVASGNFSLIENRGTLTVTGDGAITLEAATDRNWSALSAVISNCGGTLTVEGGHIQHLGGSDMAYGIDNNSTLGETVLTVKGGTIESPYRGIRLFQNSKTAMNIVNIEGGTVIGPAAIWAHQSGADSLGQINISGGVIDSYSNAVRVDIHSGGKTTVNISGGKLTNENPEANLLLVWPFSDMSTVTSANKTVMNITGGEFECVTEGNLIGLLNGADANSSVAVSGGTFSEFIAEEYCAEDFRSVANGDGTYGIVQHNLTHVEAVEATCHQNGSYEYWYCSDCEAVFADEDATQLTNRLNLTIPATVGLTHVEAVEVGCHQNGMQEYWYCAECEAVFADAAGKYLTNRMNLVIAAEPLTYVPAVEPTFEANGNYEYWYCATCDAVFADAAGTQLTNRKNLTIPALIAVAQIGEQKFESLADAIAAANDNDVIEVLSSHESAGAVINKSITIDFGGNTVTFTNGVGSGNLTSNGLQILKDNTVVLKNGTLNVAEESKALFYTLIQNYADLTVEDMTLDGTNLDKWSTHEDQVTNGDSFTLSVNNGTVNIIGATTIIANNEGSKAYAIDSCDYDGYAGAPTVNINTTGTIGKLSCDGGAYAISGGTFTNKVEEAWCAEGYIPTVVADENGMYTVEELGNNVAQNTVTGKLYESIALALMEAEGTNATIKMMADSAEYSIVVPDGVTLDLNGKTLTATYVNAFGPVVGNGLLKSVQGKTNLFAQDGYLSVWNGEGYIFITDIALSADSNVKLETTDAGLEFSFLPVLNDEMRALLADGGADNGVKLVVRMNWLLSDGNLIQEPYDVTFDDAFVQQVYSSETAQWCFVLTLKNAESLNGLTFQIVLVSDTGAELVSQTISQ